MTHRKSSVYRVESRTLIPTLTLTLTLMVPLPTCSRCLSRVEVLPAVPVPMVSPRDTWVLLFCVCLFIYIVYCLLLFDYLFIVCLLFNCLFVCVLLD